MKKITSSQKKGRWGEALAFPAPPPPKPPPTFAGPANKKDFIPLNMSLVLKSLMENSQPKRALEIIKR